MVKIIVDNDKCTGCETCINTCPADVFEIVDGKAILRLIATAYPQSVVI